MFLQSAPSCWTSQLCHRDPSSLGRKTSPTEWAARRHRGEGQQPSLCLLMAPLYSEHRWTQRRIFRQIKCWIQFIHEILFDSFLTEALTCKSSKARTLQKYSSHCKNDVRKVFISLYVYMIIYSNIRIHIWWEWDKLTRHDRPEKVYLYICTSYTYECTNILTCINRYRKNKRWKRTWRKSGKRQNKE